MFVASTCFIQFFFHSSSAWLTMKVTWTSKLWSRSQFHVNGCCTAVTESKFWCLFYGHVIHQWLSCCTVSYPKSMRNWESFIFFLMADNCCNSIVFSPGPKYSIEMHVFMSLKMLNICTMVELRPISLW